MNRWPCLNISSLSLFPLHMSLGEGTPLFNPIETSGTEQRSFVSLHLSCHELRGSGRPRPRLRCLGSHSELLWAEQLPQWSPGTCLLGFLLVLNIFLYVSGSSLASQSLDMLHSCFILLARISPSCVCNAHACWATLSPCVHPGNSHGHPF